MYVLMEYCLRIVVVTINHIYFLLFDVTSIPSNALEGCSSLETLTNPNTAIIIGRGEFAHYTSLALLSLGSSASLVDDGAFSGTAIASAIISNRAITAPNY
jgi:BspA type Leucine rich repeat region (6 copies)